MIGDAEHLKSLSGLKQKASIARWLRKNGIKFFRNAAGWPVTTPAALDRALAPGIESGPDWSAFDDKKAAAAESPRKGQKILLRRQKQVDGPQPSK